MIGITTKHPIDEDPNLTTQLLQMTETFIFSCSYHSRYLGLRFLTLRLLTSAPPEEGPCPQGRASTRMQCGPEYPARACKEICGSTSAVCTFCSSPSAGEKVCRIGFYPLSLCFDHKHVIHLAFVPWRESVIAVEVKTFFTPLLHFLPLHFFWRVVKRHLIRQ